MPAPHDTAGTYGNLFNGVSVAGNATIGAYLANLAGTPPIESQLDLEFEDGGSPPTSAIVFAAYRVRGTSAIGTPNTTVSSNANSTTIVVASATGIKVGQKVGLQQAGGSKLGEIATVSAVSGTTLTVSTLLNTYANNDAVYLISQAPAFSVAPGSATGTWAAGTDYSASMDLGTGRWFVACTNTDTNAVTAYGTYSQVDSFQ